MKLSTFTAKTKLVELALKREELNLRREELAAQKPTPAAPRAELPALNADDLGTRMGAIAAALQGPPGRDGVAGERGEIGATGARGEIGAAGRDGVDGKPGETGERGITGPQGPQGPAGDRGPAGPAGPPGPAGERGEKGEKGDTGSSGGGYTRPGGGLGGFGPSVASAISVEAIGAVPRQSVQAAAERLTAADAALASDIDDLTESMHAAVTLDGASSSWLTLVGQVLKLTLVEATTLLAGIVSIGVQSFKGVKTFVDALVLSAGVSIGGDISSVNGFANGRISCNGSVLDLGNSGAIPIRAQYVVGSSSGTAFYASANGGFSALGQLKLWSESLGAGASDTCVRVGPYIADASVNAAAKIFAGGTGLGGTFVEKFYFLKNGQLNVPGAAGISLGSAAGVITHNGTGFTMASRCTNSEYWQGTLFYHTGTGVSLEAAACARLSSDAADGASAVAATSESSTAWSNATAKLHAFKNNGVEQANVDQAGNLQLNVAGAARPTAGASHRGKIWYSKSAGGAADTVEVCLKSAGDTYSWVTIATG